MKKVVSYLFFLGLSTLFNPTVWAQNSLDDCLLNLVKTDQSGLSAAQIRKHCQAQQEESGAEVVQVERQSIVTAEQGQSQSTLMRKIGSDVDFADFALQPRPRNFAMPIYATNRFNREVYAAFADLEEHYIQLESKFQLGIMHSLKKGNIFFPGDGIYFSFTNEAWWQVYSDNVSKPFRETNYKPEIFYITPTAWQPNDGNTAVMIGFEHQSNGRSLPLSRSWNRIYTQLMYQKDNFAFTFKPWVRLPEDEKTAPDDPKGDDNPDIDDYLGHFEIYSSYAFTEKIKGRMMLRRNFATHKGAVEFNLTFPMPWLEDLDWYFTLFDGYGDSLIDYNHRQSRIGFGIAVRQ